MAIDGAVQQALDGGHLPPPTDQIRLSTPDGAMPVAHAQQPAGGHRLVGTLDLNQLSLAQGRCAFNQSRGGRAKHHPTRRGHRLHPLSHSDLLTNRGEQVGMAQRMESVAPPGGVMLSASTARLVEGAAALGEPELVQIKGADEPVPARRLLGMGDGHRAVGRAESNLVGRQWEMSAVEGLLDRAIEGHGAVVGVVGPPGIGKSRLVREVAAMALRRGVEVFTTFCESHTSQVPFHAVARLLRAATGVEGLDAQAARRSSAGPGARRRPGGLAALR